jgi:hypothetical protein
MGMWWSIEVIDGSTSADAWHESWGDAIVEAALAEQADDWSWHQHRWGVVLEVSLPDDAAWERFLATPVVITALDSVPDPTFGLIVYRGRGGSAGSAAVRPKRPLAGAGAMALPIPEPFDDALDDSWSVERVRLFA